MPRELIAPKGDQRYVRRKKGSSRLGRLMSAVRYRPTAERPYRPLSRETNVYLAHLGVRATEMRSTCGIALN
jgi:hypothetical protein